MSAKYREGACENCGALGHKRVDCLEKPRKRLAKYGAGVIAADDTQAPDFKFSYDGEPDIYTQTFLGFGFWVWVGYIWNMVLKISDSFFLFLYMSNKI